MKRLMLIACLAAPFLPVNVQAQQNRVEISITPVTGPVYMLQGGGGNIGVVADPLGVLMIDAMETPSSDQIRAAIKSLPGGDRVRVLVDTHWHSDHTDGNKSLGLGAAIIAHENVRPLLGGEQDQPGRKAGAGPAAALPNVTYSDRLTVYAGGEEIRLVHYSHAHTDGDTVVFLDKSKVVHMGDMFFNGRFPFLDVANGGDIDNWVRQIDAILAVLPADSKIIPGHGPLASTADLKAFRQMLYDSAEIVRNEMKEGKTLEQVKAAGLPERFAPWSKGFMSTPRWLELVYRSLEKQGAR